MAKHGRSMQIAPPRLRPGEGVLIDVLVDSTVGTARCLKDYEVVVFGNPLVGAKAAAVETAIVRLGDSIVKWVEQIEQALAALPRPMTAPQRAVAVVKLACSAFVAFLTAS